MVIKIEDITLVKSVSEIQQPRAQYHSNEIAVRAVSTLGHECSISFSNEISLNTHTQILLKNHCSNYFYEIRNKESNKYGISIQPSHYLEILDILIKNPETIQKHKKIKIKTSTIYKKLTIK